MAWQHDPSPPDPAPTDPKAQQMLRELVGERVGASELDELEAAFPDANPRSTYAGLRRAAARRRKS